MSVFRSTAAATATVASTAFLSRVGIISLLAFAAFSIATFFAVRNFDVLALSCYGVQRIRQIALSTDLGTRALRTMRNRFAARSTCVVVDFVVAFVADKAASV